MIMANLAQIEDGHIVVDPFVGTGLLSAIFKLKNRKLIIITFSQGLYW